MANIKQIKITQANKTRLDKLKKYKRETYDDVITRLLKNDSK